jgi:hypothetical protein
MKGAIISPFEPQHFVTQSTQHHQLMMEKQELPAK